MAHRYRILELLMRLLVLSQHMWRLRVLRTCGSPLRKPECNSATLRLETEVGGVVVLVYLVHEDCMRNSFKLFRLPQHILEVLL